MLSPAVPNFSPSVLLRHPGLDPGFLIVEGHEPPAAPVLLAGRRHLAIIRCGNSLHSLEEQKGPDSKEKYLVDIFLFSLDAVKNTNMFIEFKLWNFNDDAKNKLNGVIIDCIEKKVNLSIKNKDVITSGKGIMNLGNIHESSFTDIIYGARASKISSGFSKRIAVEELCRKCTYRDRFDRLPVMHRGNSNSN